MGWLSGLKRRFAKPFSRKGGTGSNPVPTAENEVVNLEGWPSGLRREFRKPVGAIPHRFESCTLRMEQQSAQQQEEFASSQERSTLTKEETLFSWKAPVRPFKARGRQFFSTVLLVAALLSIIGFVLEGLMVVFLVWAVVFLVFVLFSVPPEEIEYAITNKNIVIAGKRYPLQEVSRFWITERWGHTLLVFETPLRFPGRLELVLVGIDKEQVKQRLEEKVPYEEEAPGFADKAAGWLSKRLSLDERG